MILLLLACAPISLDAAAIDAATDPAADTADTADEAIGIELPCVNAGNYAGAEVPTEHLPIMQAGGVLLGEVVYLGGDEWDHVAQFSTYCRSDYVDGRYILTYYLAYFDVPYAAVADCRAWLIAPEVPGDVGCSS